MPSRSGGRASSVNDYRMLEEGEQGAAIGAFLLAHEDHMREVEVQRGSWTVYCYCARCDDVRTYEVDNEARKRALERLLGLPRREDEEGPA
jgi:hypothetical protein